MPRYSSFVLIIALVAASLTPVAALPQKLRLGGNEVSTTCVSRWDKANFNRNESVFDPSAYADGTDSIPHETFETKPPVAGRAPAKQFGKIKGRVVDINNARIVRADVVIAGEGLRWRLRTNSEGEFEMSLPIGEYQLSVEANGFRRSASQKFEIKSGKTQRLNIEMKIMDVLVPAVSDPQSDS